MQAGLTLSLIILSVAVFIVDQLSGGALLVAGAKTSAIWSGEWYRLFTATFLHSGLVHIAFNMYALYIFGQLVESLAGAKRFLATYLISGAIGYMASLWAIPDIPAVGASASIFGLMGYTLHYRLRRLPKRFLPIDSALLQILVINLVLGFVVPQIDQMAHVGGLLGGFLVASLVGIPNPLERREQSVAEKFAALLVVALFTVAALNPAWTASALKSAWPGAADWVEARYGPYMAPLRAEGITVVWNYLDSGSEWMPVNEELQPLPGRYVRLGAFWRWDRGTGPLQNVEYKVAWELNGEDVPTQTHVDKGFAMSPDVSRDRVYLRSWIAAQPGTWTVRVTVEDREVFSQTVHIKTAVPGRYTS